jgi:hypothetical protein
MWVVLLDGVGCCASPRSGRAALRGRPTEKGPYPVLGRRTDAAAPPKPPILAVAGSQKLRMRETASSAERVRFHSRFSLRNRSVLPAQFQGHTCECPAIGVDQFAVRAAFSLTKAPARS